MIAEDVLKQKTEWKRKGWAIPDLRGSKQEWFALVTELVQSINTSVIADLNAVPTLNTISVSSPWSIYVPFLKGIGLISNRSGVLSLSDVGLDFLNNPTKMKLAFIIHDRFRLFGEILCLIESTPKTVEEIDEELRQSFQLGWSKLNNTRRRMDWLESLNLVENVGSRRWCVTEDGKQALNNWIIVTPSVLEEENKAEVTSLAAAPSSIGDLLEKLKNDPSLQNKRNTYNIWAPSPNRIENIRMIVQFSMDRISRSDLFRLIEEEFHLKTSSVESMMPFLRADGFLEEVGRGIYVATAAAKEWCLSGNDIDFIRILHVHKRFVGEMIECAKQVISRNDIYSKAKSYGLNIDKTRWIMGMLLEAGLLEETQYLHVKATPLGLLLLNELPLAEAPSSNTQITDNVDIQTAPSLNSVICSNGNEELFDSLSRAARDPMAEGKASGVAFEEEIASVFRVLGFEATRIGGAGNTDVVVRWKDDDGKTITAIVDGKSKTGGTVTHGDISDIAIETHKEKNDADFVAIVGPGFSGDTIKNHAKKKGFALITDAELIDITKHTQSLGLSLSEVAMMFIVPNGLSQLNELIATKEREHEIITLVISTFRQEQDAMDSLSARDLYFLLRGTDLSPSLEELIHAFETLSKDEINVLTLIKKASSTENTTYSIQGEKRCINKLRALADAIERGLS